MNRLLSRVGVRAASVGLLLAGVAGGVYLGRGEEVHQQGVQAQLVQRVDAAEVDMLKERHAAHAAARAPQREAEAVAAQKAATEAKAAAGRAHKMEKAAIAKKSAQRAAEKKAAEKAAEAKAAEKKAAEQGEQADDADDSDDAESGKSGKSTKSKPYDGPIPSSCKQYKGPKKVGCAMVLDAGMSLKQMGCLEELWQKESGWNPKARNKSSRAYGIPQAKPGKKMASAGDDWEDNPATQIKWGLGYIKSRYGTPCGAWSHSQRRGWY